jgi:hypothetical protein
MQDGNARCATSIEAARALSHVAVADGGLVAVTLLVTRKRQDSCSWRKK